MSEERAVARIKRLWNRRGRRAFTVVRSAEGSMSNSEDIRGLRPADAELGGDFDIMTKGEDGEWHQLAEQDEPSPCYLPATVLYRPDQPIEPARVLPSREEVRESILSILAASDHEGGAGMHWLPSKRPTEQAESVADHISDAILALFAKAGGVRVLAVATMDVGGEVSSKLHLGYPEPRDAELLVIQVPEREPPTPAQPVPDAPEVGLPSVGGGQHG